MPNVPTLHEQGVTDYDMSGWFATFLPANASPAVVATLRDIVRRASKTSYVVDALATASFEPLDLTGDQLVQLHRADIEKWGRIVRASGKKP